MTGSYEDCYARSLRNPHHFWAEAAREIEWVRRPRAVLNDSDPERASWFPGGKLNSCYNALDLHVLAGRGEQTALVYDSPVTQTVRSYTYREVLERVSKLAGALRALGVEKRDRVLLYMPMVPEAVFGMLAAARLGAVHSVVFGGFASGELAQRIQHAAPKVVLTASCGIEPTHVVEYKPLLEAAIARVSNKPAHCVVLQRPERPVSLLAERDLDWGALEAAASPVGCVPVEAKDPLYILYTSGTTGVPKGVVRDNGGHAVALKWSMRHVYDVRPG
ncbi:MAG: AMP-binding protein, partial [Myxococcales bacterium]|nr:AMP-binding protein [Myxococcales bacterium]